MLGEWLALPSPQRPCGVGEEAGLRGQRLRTRQTAAGVTGAVSAREHGGGVILSGSSQSVNFLLREGPYEVHCG